MEETSLVKEVKKIAKISPSNCLQTQKTLLSLENSARTTRLGLQQRKCRLNRETLKQSS